MRVSPEAVEAKKSFIQRSFKQCPCCSGANYHAKSAAFPTGGEGDYMLMIVLTCAGCGWSAFFDAEAPTPA